MVVHLLVILADNYLTPSMPFPAEKPPPYTLKPEIQRLNIAANDRRYVLRLTL